MHILQASLVTALCVTCGFTGLTNAALLASPDLAALHQRVKARDNLYNPHAKREDPDLVPRANTAAAEKTGDFVIPVVPDAAELRKLVPHEIEPKDVPKGKVPNSCPMPAGGPPAAKAPADPARRPPAARAPAGLAAIDTSVGKKRAPPQLSSHTDKALKYRDSFNEAVFKLNSNADVINDAVKKLKAIDKVLKYHREAVINLTATQRAKYTKDKSSLEEQVRLAKLFRPTLKRMQATAAQNLVTELCWLGNWSARYGMKPPAEIAELVTDYAYYAKMGVYSPTAALSSIADIKAPKI